MNDLDKILDKLCEDPAFVRAYREERITWELQARAVCRYLRGEVERLEARVNSGAETVICRHHNLWVDVYDTKKSYRCPDCGLEYDEVTHE